MQGFGFSFAKKRVVSLSLQAGKVDRRQHEVNGRATRYKRKIHLGVPAFLSYTATGMACGQVFGHLS